MASHHDGTGPTKSPVDAGPSTVSAINPFATNLPVENPDGMETADAPPPKRKRIGYKFETLRLPDNPFLHVLTDGVAKLEEETNTTVATVAAKLK